MVWTTKNNFYRIDGVYDSKEFYLELNNESMLSSDYMEIWYSQALIKHTMENNSGRTCFTVSAEYNSELDQQDTSLRTV